MGDELGLQNKQAFLCAHFSSSLTSLYLSSSLLVPPTQVVSAVKHTVVDRPLPHVDSVLGPMLLRFLLLMGDEDRHVRRAAVVALSGCAHAKPGLVVGDLAQLLPLLYAQTAVREDMIRTVDLGPFKHKVGWKTLFIGTDQLAGCLTVTQENERQTRHKHTSNECKDASFRVGAFNCSPKT